MNFALFNDYFTENYIYDHDNDFYLVESDRSIEVLEDFYFDYSNYGEYNKYYLTKEDVTKKFSQFNGLLLTLLENLNLFTEKALVKIFSDDPIVNKYIQAICFSSSDNRKALENFIKALDFISTLTKEELAKLKSTCPKTNVAQSGLFKTNKPESNIKNNNENSLNE